MNSFSGGDKLERYLAELARKIQNPGTLRVGFLEGATYPDGTPVPLVASVQEFGSPAQGVPARPFFRGMIADKSPTWGPAMGEVLKQTDFDAAGALRLMGEGIKGQLQQSIIEFDRVPLSPLTIARKGNDKQLVDTGHMLNSVDYEVEAAR